MTDIADASFLFNICGLYSYTSLENADTQKIADRFGYPTSMVLGIRCEDGNLYKSDNLLSVKYYIGTKEDAMQYPIVAETADYVLYENENALPFHIM